MGIARPILWKSRGFSPPQRPLARCGPWNLCRQGDVWLPGSLMDDKTINLWRQIENGRRRGTKRGLLGKPARKAINDN